MHSAFKRAKNFQRNLVVGVDERPCIICTIR